MNSEYRIPSMAEIEALPWNGVKVVSTFSGAVMNEIYYNLKRENGYGQDSIDRKRCALEGVLVPIKSRWNEQMLRCVGFSHIDCFWRWMNFAAWVAVK